MKRVGQQHMQDNNRCWRRGGHTHTHTGKGHAGMIFMSLYLYGFLISFRGSRPGLGWAGCCTAEGCLAGEFWRQILRQDVLATKKLDHARHSKKKNEAKSPPKCQQKYDIKLRAHMQSTHAHTHTHICT